MSEIVEFPIASGGSLLIEVRDTSVGRTKKVSHSGDTIQKATRTLESTLEDLRPGIEAIRKSFDTVVADEVEVKFGVEFKVESGWVILRAVTSATLEVTLTWKKVT